MSLSQAAWNLARQGRYDDALELLELEIAVSGEPRASDLRIDAAEIAIEAHQLGRGFEHAVQAATVLQGHDPQRWLEAMCCVADAQYDLGDLVSAEATYQSTLALFAQRGDAAGEARVWMELGNVASARGRHADADSRYSAAARLYEQIGDSEDLARLGVNWGTTLRDLGDRERARQVLWDARRRAQAIGARRLVADCDSNLASVATASGDLSEAAHLHESARSIYAEIGLDTEVADCDDGLGALACTAGRYRDAVALHQVAAEVYGRHAHPVQRAICHANLAHALLHLGEPERAVELATNSAEDLGRHGHAVSAEWSLGILVSAHLAAADVGGAELALERYRVSLQQRRATDPWLDVSTGELACSGGDTTEAVRCCERAAAHYRSEDLPLGVIEVAATAAEAFIRAGEPGAALPWQTAATEGCTALGLHERAAEIAGL